MAALEQLEEAAGVTLRPREHVGIFEQRLGGIGKHVLETEGLAGTPGAGQDDCWKGASGLLQVG